MIILIIGLTFTSTSCRTVTQQQTLLFWLYNSCLPINHNFPQITVCLFVCCKIKPEENIERVMKKMKKESIAVINSERGSAQGIEFFITVVSFYTSSQ